MQDKKEKNKYDRSGSTKKNIRFEDDLIDKINQQAQKDSESFAGWVKEDCKQRLDRDAK